MTPTESIDLLVADGIVDALVSRVKTGKEAEVFIVRKGDHYFAAKVYKERTDRNFKNNVAYREGRQMRNTRDARAVAKGSKYGVKLAESDWRHMEHDALVEVSAAGVRVPKPELIYEGILLMELVLGADGQPAPRLIDVPLSRDEAVAMHRDVVGQIVVMLTCDLIHGDLSPYNILMAWNGPTIIDLPQAIKAAHNSQAEQFLVRDVRNVTEHFARYAPELKKRIHDGYAIWRRYMKRDLPRDYFPEEGEAQPPREHHRPQHHAPKPHGAAHPASHGHGHAHAAKPAHPPAHGHAHTAKPAHPPAAKTAHRTTPPRPPGPVAGNAHPPRREQHAPRNNQGGGHRPPRPAETHRRPAASGPIIERVTRLAPAAPPSTSGSAQTENRPSRFSQHHRHRG